MGISQAMYTGVSGLSANSDGMSVTANNIANANAKGFKRDRAEFEDLISQDLTSGTGRAQLGRGARLRDVKTMHTQGGLQVTDNITDLAIQGNGFFILSKPGADSASSAGKFFSRVGSMQFDKDGYLTDSHGNRAQGFMPNKKGNLSSRLTDVRIETNIIPPNPTQKVVLNVNLDAREKIKEGSFDIKNPEETSNFNNTISVFDTQGRAHPATVFYKRVHDGDGIAWEWNATVPSTDVSDGEPNAEFHSIANGRVKFDIYGKLLSEETERSEANFANGALQGQKIDFDFGQNIQDEKGDGLGASTAIAAKFDTIFHSQDGFENGTLKSFNIELDGRIVGIFTNGLQKDLGAIGLATFENQDGLLKAGQNTFDSTIDSGPPKIGMPGSGTRGEIYASTLEESNVDLASEFVNMIMGQRLFQANSRSVTTADAMIEEVINIKR